MKVKIITANRTLSGSVVYLTPSGEWTATFSEAFWSADVELLAEKLAFAQSQQAIVCDPYLLVVNQAEGRITPRTKREEIRATGPNVMLESLGYGQTFLRAAQGDEGAAHVSV